MTKDSYQQVRHFSNKQLVISWISRNLFGHLEYTQRHGLIAGMRRRGGLGWLPERFGGSPTAETLFWSMQDFRGKVVYDIGAFYGILTLFFARTARAVVAYEPNDRNYECLRRNIELNSLHNVQVRRVAIGERSEVAAMEWHAATPGAAKIIPVSDEHRRAQRVQIVSLDEDIQRCGLPAPDFIKIDTEGFELSALIGAHDTLRKHRPELFLEMHGETMAEKVNNATAILRYLGGHGYMARHIESDSIVTAANTTVAAQGHLYCTATA